MSWAAIVSGKARQTSPIPVAQQSTSNTSTTTTNFQSNQYNTHNLQSSLPSSPSENSPISQNNTLKSTDLNNKNTKRKNNNSTDQSINENKQTVTETQSPQINGNYPHQRSKPNQSSQQNKSKSHQRRQQQQQQHVQTSSPQSKHVDPSTPRISVEKGHPSPKLSQQQQSPLNTSLWNDPQTLASYHLWTQHIMEFMAQPVIFFHLFVVDPQFQKSVFEAGLTFHRETDPNNPVLINLNSSRFGMADRISALSPPAGLESRSTPRSSFQPPSKSSHPFSPLSEVSQPLPSVPNSVSLASAETGENGYNNSGSANSDESTGYPEPIFPINGIDGQGMAPFYMTNRYVDDNLVRRFMDGVRMEASDSESERLSEVDLAISNGSRYGLFSTYDFHTPRYSSKRGDGRQQINSRVQDTRLPSEPKIEKQSDMAQIVLVEQIEDLFPQISSSEDFPLVQADLLQRMRGIIANEWEGAGIDVYGSAGNNLGLQSADVDMSVYMPSALGNEKGSERSKSEASQVVLARLASLMSAKGIIVQGKFLSARVPVIKLFDPETKLHVDVCVNNILAVKNTELLKAYVDLDPRFRYVCILVKLWAKNRRLNDAYAGTLSSYAYTLLVIHYLQTLDPPVLPCLQQMVKGERVEDLNDLPHEMTDNGNGELYNTYFDRSVTPETYKSDNITPVHELLLDFFKYYGYTFQYRTHLVSIRRGTIVDRSERKWDEGSVYEEWDRRTADYKVQREQAKAAHEAIIKAEAEERMKASITTNDVSDKSPVPRAKREYFRRPPKPRLASKHLFCIEDPFDIDHDLSRGMEKAAVTVIRQEMIRAYEIIAESGRYDVACEEYDIE